MYFCKVSKCKSNAKKKEPINTFTKKSPKAGHTISNALSFHFASVAIRIVSNNKSKENNLDKLQGSCNSKNISTILNILQLHVFKVFKVLKQLNKSQKA